MTGPLLLFPERAPIGYVTVAGVRQPVFISSEFFRSLAGTIARLGGSTASSITDSELASYIRLMSAEAQEPDYMVPLVSGVESELGIEPSWPMQMMPVSEAQTSWPMQIMPAGDDEAWPPIVMQPSTTVDSGFYTPTLTNVANLTASTAYKCQWLRVDDTVMVSGKVDVDPTAAASTQLGISLPQPSRFAAEQDCCGTAFAKAIANQGAAILADAVNDRAQMEWIAVDLTNQAMYFTFFYEVL